MLRNLLPFAFLSFTFSCLACFAGERANDWKKFVEAQSPRLFEAYCFTDWAECELFIVDNVLYTRILPASERSPHSRNGEYELDYTTLSDGSSVFALVGSNINKLSWSSYCSELDNYSIKFRKVVGDCAKKNLTLQANLRSSRIPGTKLTQSMQVEDGLIMWHLRQDQDREALIKQLQAMMQSQ